MELDQIATAEQSASRGTSDVSAINAAPASPHKFVSFFIGENQYALHSSVVAEVAGQLAPTPVPASPKRLAGIASLRGDIVAVLDLNPDGGVRLDSQAKPKSVILRSPDPHSEMSMAFNVDGLGELVSIDPASIRHAEYADPLSQYEASINGRTFRLIEASRILSLLTDVK